jgi:hypothetical protein
LSPPAGGREGRPYEADARKDIALTTQAATVSPVRGRRTKVPCVAESRGAAARYNRLSTTMTSQATAQAVPPPQEEPEGHRVTWSGLTLTFRERTLNALVRRALEEIPELRDLSIELTPGELAATIVVHRFGVPLSARATASQLRLKDGFLAFVLDRVQALSFIPIPDQLLTYLVQKAPPGLLTYYPEDRIMVVNLNEWMPPGVDLSLERTQFQEGALTLHFAPGSYDLSGLMERATRIDD